jgi:hypothetical protein
MFCSSVAMVKFVDFGLSEDSKSTLSLSGGGNFLPEKMFWKSV